MEITSGKISEALKIVVYGVEGVGKTTFASQFPDVIFSDTEGSTARYDFIRRLPKPSSWSMLLEEVKYVRDYKPCKTYVIDTADWAERLCSEHICARANLNNIEDFGWGHGYTYLTDEFGKLLDLLEEVKCRGVNVIFNAHCMIRKIELPDEMGAYDKYELKTTKGVSSLIKEWADLILFANFKTYVTYLDKENKKGRARENGRVMYSQHNACWDAKNRDGLPEMMNFDFNEIRHLFEPVSSLPEQVSVTPQTVSSAPKQEEVTAAKEFTVEQVANLKQQGFSVDEIIDDEPEQQELAQDNFVKEAPVPPLPSDSDNPVIQKLYQLMNEKGMSTDVLQATVADAGYFPRSTPIENYPRDFIEGCLIGAWDSVCAKAQQYMQTAFN